MGANIKLREKAKEPREIHTVASADHVIFKHPEKLFVSNLF